jgi:hypothetical protein
MKGQEIESNSEMEERRQLSVTWVVRDRRGKRVLGTASSLHAAIKHAGQRGEQFPLLERLSHADADLPGPVLWRRTL